ncbi:TfoX/Sxy family protein [Arthrobacter gandavensis]|uniref:TfoX/Sxy family protein n=1 Tax=Arthrobacter gandavensis TaxID=169960 RepID=UPI00188FE61B|nr:TfoX/Sxy family protein [Arthrobacter gandavensis]MBF4992780.1 TfoX/Sxy family protein [Arthrobacter gandavensis]
MNVDPFQETLVQRIRANLASHGDVREKRMFGGVSFMVDGQLAVAAGKDGDLLVRVDPAQYQNLLTAGGQPACMGVGRPMGEGWMNVPPEIIVDDESLAWWIAVGRTSRRT